MKTKNYLVELNLQLFAEGSGGAGSAGGNSGVTGSAAGSQSGVNGNSAATVGGENGQAAAVDPSNPNQNGQDLDAEFEELIKGKFKNQFGKKTQGIVQERLKSSKEALEKKEAFTPALEIVAKKYGVDPSDANALMEALQADDTNFEKEALERGMSVENLRMLKKVEAERDAARRENQLTQREQYRLQQYKRWTEQASAANQIYPNLDLETELQDPQFKSLLMNGVDVRTAYEVKHRDEILAGAMEFATKKAQEQFTNSVIANGSRPSENGASGQAAGAGKVDVSKMSRAELIAYQKRIANGERVDFTQ